MKKIVPILFLIIIVACGKKNQQVGSTVAVDSLKSIIVNKKMLEIEGGEYKAFFGQDSGNVVKIKSFLMDETPVTNKEFLEFVKANPQWSKSKVLKLYAESSYLKNWTTDFEIPVNISPNAPVTNVSWYAAKAYAKSAGKRLPTVDEWEYVGVADKERPNASDDPAFVAKILESYKTGERYKIPVKKGEANFYGVYDMYGSVWEWTSDFNSVMISGESRNNNQKNEDLFCAGASLTSSDLKNYAAFIRFAMRGSLKANYCINNLGFRCVKDIN